MTDNHRSDILWVLALAPPLAVRLHADGGEAALQRLLLLAVTLALFYAWAALFARRAGRPVGPGLPAAALIFALMLPGPVPWGGAVLSISFGAVLGREVFGGRAILPPALIALAFAIFSFPEAGFEERDILALAPDPALAVACLPGAALLALSGLVAWPVVLGAAAGIAAAGLLAGDPAWWAHYATGTLAAGVLFLAAPTDFTARGPVARVLHGLSVGALVILFRLADPDQPDGIVFAALLGGLFAPLLDRALAWRPGRA